MSDEPRIYVVPSSVPWAPVILPPQLDELVIARFLECLTLLNLDYLAKHPDTIAVYESGIEYVRDEIGRERWRSIPYILIDSSADCKSLVAWRVAELRMKGEKAQCGVRAEPMPGGWMLYHVFVKRANGSIEDPSAILGMNWGEANAG